MGLITGEAAIYFIFFCFPKRSDELPLPMFDRFLCCEHQTKPAVSPDLEIVAETVKVSWIMEI